MERAYTVAEIDALTFACELKLFGHSLKHSGYSDYRAKERDVATRAPAIHELVRTYMMAGVNVPDVVAAVEEEQENRRAEEERFHTARRQANLKQPLKTL